MAKTIRSLDFVIVEGVVYDVPKLKGMEVSESYNVIYIDVNAEYHYKVVKKKDVLHINSAFDLV